jgi:GTPase SAR1 family protein
VKIIIKGEKTSGKTTLFNIINGEESISENYVPTVKLNNSIVNWYYKNTEDSILLEVYDTISQEEDIDEVYKLNKSLQDVRNKKVMLGSHTFTINSLINLYKDSHCVFLIFNVTKKSSFDYIKNEIDVIPQNMEICK